MGIPEDIREKIAGIDFCWCICGEKAVACKKQDDCPAFMNRKNERNYKKANQILAFIYEEEEVEWKGRLLDKGWLPPDEAERYVKLADDQSVDLSSLESQGSTIPLHYRTFELMWGQGFRKMEVKE